MSQGKIGFNTLQVKKKIYFNDKKISIIIFVFLI